MTLDVFSLTRELIDIPSPTNSERQVAEYLEMKLSALGFNVERQKVSDERFNVIATMNAKPRVMLCTHIDTVPPFFPSREEEKFIYGRGACDTKGTMAAMLCAGEQLLAAGVKEFGYLLVVGEETDSIGAKMANELGSRIGSEYIVVGEPTESVFVRASKGALTAVVRFSGIAAHSAYPERGDSAVLKMVEAVRDIAAADWGRHDILGVGTANVGVVRGGEKANIIPAHAEIEMIFRTVKPIADVRRQLEAIVVKYGGEIVRSHGNDPVPMLVPRGAKSQVVAFNTDVPHLPAFGRPILFGPGSILDAHSATERIDRDEFARAVDTYQQLVRQLLAGEVESDD